MDVNFEFIKWCFLAVNSKYSCAVNVHVYHGSGLADSCKWSPTTLKRVCSATDFHRFVSSWKISRRCSDQIGTIFS